LPKFVKKFSQIRQLPAFRTSRQRLLVLLLIPARMLLGKLEAGPRRTLLLGGVRWEIKEFC